MNLLHRYGFSGSRKWRDEIISFDCEVEIDSSSSPTKTKMCVNPYRASLQFAEIAASRLKKVLAVDQIGLQDITDHSTFYVHEAKSSSTFWSSTINSVSSSEITVNGVSQNGVMPPTSASSFISSSGSLDVDDVAVLTGYNASFGNRSKYSSQYDVISLLDVNRITNAATLLARSGLNAAGLSDVSSISANISLVQNLVSCFGENPGCELFQRYTTLEETSLQAYYKQDDDHVAIPLYVSVYSQPYILHGDKAVLSLESFDNSTDRIVRPRSLATPVEIFVRNFLADVTSDTAMSSRSPCDNSCNEPDECIDSFCVPNPTSYYHSALDPAFNETKYATYEISSVMDGPAFTEPYWSGNFGPTLGVRIYLSDRSALDWIPFVLGILFFVGCFYVSSRLQAELLRKKVM